MRRRKIWQVYPERPELVQEVASRHGLPRLVARLLLNRGLTESDDILAFLMPELSRLSSPFNLPDLQEGSARLAQYPGSCAEAGGDGGVSRTVAIDRRYRACRARLHHQAATGRPIF